jgi:hypothetical protein
MIHGKSNIYTCCYSGRGTKLTANIVPVTTAVKIMERTSILLYAVRVLLLRVLLECISLYYPLVLHVLWAPDTSSKKDYFWKFKLI